MNKINQTSIAVALWAIFFVLLAHYYKGTGTNEQAGTPTFREAIVEVVGMKTNIHEGLGATTGFIAIMPNGEHVEIPYNKVLGIPAMPHRPGDWQPGYFTVVWENGKIMAATQANIRRF